MNSVRKWQMAALAGLVLAATWTGPAQADFTFGTPVNLGPQVNSSENEYDPAISADGLELYFQSYRAGGYGLSDLYVARRATVADAWQSAENLGPVVNTAAAESGPSLSFDGLTLYFNSDRPGGLGGHDLWMTTRASRSAPWGEPVNLGPVVNSEFSEINPNISHDGLSLYFADVEGDGSVLPRPGGVGDTDIWVTTRASLSDPWGPPVNLGTPVNSTGIDGSPDLSPDGLLLFFNRCPNSQTFFDLWVAARKTTQDPWGVPVSLGAPVNTVNWDGNAELAADGRTLYFISCCRPGGVGTTDIWQVSLDPIVDFSGDGKVDETEVRILVENWGKNEPLCDIGPTPFGDGIIDMQDLAVLTQCAGKELIDSTLLACWKFDQTEGTTTCDCAEGCQGELVGGPVWQPGAGAVGGALQLDGVDDHVRAGFLHDPGAGPLSVFAWVKGGKPGQVILSQQTGFDWLAADGAAGALMTDLRSASRDSMPLASSKVITDGNWHRIGLIWDGATRKLYVDGVAVAQDKQRNLKSAYGNLRIGAGKDLAAGTFWSGLIDDVRIYQRVIQP
jgi:hypothetical protein